MDNNKPQNEILDCIDCGQAFRFTIGEQEYYHSKNLSTPKRCPACRKKRRETLVPDKARGGQDANQ